LELCHVFLKYAVHQPMLKSFFMQVRNWFFASVT
jgi:hypothetical protein